MIVALLISLFTYSMAFAADPIECVVEDGTATVTVEVGSLEETTLLVVPMGTTIQAAFNDPTLVYYINQVAANSDGVATFEFAPTEAASYDIYSGYATMGINDKPYKTVIDKSGQGGNTPSTPDFTFGDVDNDGDIDGSDAGYIIAYVVHGTEFDFDYGKQAADVNHNGGVDGSDAGYVIAYAVRGDLLPEAPAQ
jgi:hypothetical protein